MKLDPEDTAQAHDSPGKRSKTSSPVPQESQIWNLRYGLAENEVVASRREMKAKFPDIDGPEDPLSGRAVHRLAVLT